MMGIDDSRFARLDDAACHQACIDHWELRDEFIAYFNRSFHEQLTIGRRGHVSFRFDYNGFAANTGLLLFGAFTLLPTIAILEHLPDSRSSKNVAFTIPFAMLGALIYILVANGGWNVAFAVGFASWIVVSLVSLLSIQHWR